MKNRGEALEIYGMPAGMWLLFGSSFEKQLSETLNFNNGTAKEITKRAKKNIGI